MNEELKMVGRLVKMIFKIAFGTLALYWINNPASPLSIPVFWSGDFHWYPIFTPDYVLHYQIFFSLTTAAGIIIGVMDFIFFIFGKLWEIVDELVGIVGLLIVREMPRAAINAPANISEQVFIGAYWFINFVLFFAVLGLVIKTFKWLSLKDSHTNSK